MQMSRDGNMEGKYIIIKSGGVYVTKAVLWGTFIVKNVYLEKKESWKSNIRVH